MSNGRRFHILGGMFLVAVLGLAGCGGGGGSGSDPQPPVPEPPTPEPPTPEPPTPEPPTPEPPRTPVPAAWTPANPGGGGAFSNVAVGPGGEPLVVATDLSGVAISHDAGRSWRVAGAFAGLDVTHVAAVAVDGADPRRIYAGTEDGLYVSADGGGRFARLGLDGYVSAVAAQGGRVYAAAQPSFDVAGGALYVSADAGGSWERVALPPGRYVVAVKPAMGGDDRALVLTGAGRFTEGPAELYLYEGGALRRIAPDLERIVDAAFDPADSSVIWATTDDADTDHPGWLWRGGDGVRWERVAPRGGVLWLPAANPHTLRLIDPRHQFPWDPRNGTWESADGGGSWRHVAGVEDWHKGWSRVYWAYTDGFGGPVPSLAFDPTDPDRALWVNAQWAYQSTDGGRTFRPVFTDEVRPGWWRSRGLDNVVVADIALDADGQAIYAGYWDLGCFRSLDGGASWANCNTLEYSGDWEGYGGFAGTVAADPERPGVVWAAHAQDWASPAVLLRSTDHGASWTKAAGLPSGRADLLGLAVNPASPRHARELLVTHDGDVYGSVDDGLTWALAFACGGCRVTAFGPDGTAYAGGEAGLWRRGPSGWMRVAGDWGGAVTGPPWTGEWRGVVAIEPVGERTLWVAVLGAGGGVYRSGDGEAWERVLAGPFYRDVTVDPRRPDIVYAASSSALEQGGYDPRSLGLQVSEDGGRTWRVRNEGLAWPFVTQVRAGQGRVVLGSPGVGVAVGAEGG